MRRLVLFVIAAAGVPPDNVARPSPPLVFTTLETPDAKA
jgi:hypothetical protein